MESKEHNTVPQTDDEVHARFHEMYQPEVFADSAYGMYQCYRAMDKDLGVVDAFLKTLERITEAWEAKHTTPQAQP